MDALVLENVGFRYQPGGSPVLEEVSLNLPDGDMVGLLGPNGAGKSTLIRLINGLLRPAKGKVSLQGRDLGSFSRRELALRMAVVHQTQSLVFPYTVEETVAMGRWARAGWRAWGGEKDRMAVWEAMARTEIDHLKERHLGGLSGGERQRVYLARALAQETPVLLLDEPVAHLDVKHQLGILKLLRDINQNEGRTILLALHDLNLAAEFCRRILVLHGGGLTAQGTPEEVISRELLEKVFGVRSVIDRNPLCGSLRVTMG